MKDFEVRIPVFKCYNCNETFASNGVGKAWCRMTNKDGQKNWNWPWKIFEFRIPVFKCYNCDETFASKELANHDAEYHPQMLEC